MYFPICYVEPPRTKFQAWLSAIWVLIVVLFLEAIYAGIFASGAHQLIQGNIEGDPFWNAVMMTTVGLLTSFFWPVITWSFGIKLSFDEAWNFNAEGKSVTEKAPAPD